MAEKQVYMSAVKTVCKTTDSEGRHRCIHFQRFPSTTACEEAYNRRSAQKQLQHPNICQVYEVQREGNSVRTDMEWCGQALLTLQRAWTQEDCWYLLCSVSVALAYAQRQGVAHGSLQPAAFYFTEEEGYKVGKFAFSDSSLSSDALYDVKKPFFLCPAKRKAYSSLLLGESIVQTSLNPYKSDVFSFALVLIHLLKPETSLNLPSVQSLLPSLSLHETIQGLLQRMLEPEEENRVDWTDLERELQALQGGAAKEELKEEEVREAAGQSKKRRIKIVKRAQTAELVPVAVDRLCPACRQSFLLTPSEPWRLDLIGSASSEPAAQYCCKACFEQSFTAPPHSQPSFPLEEEEEDEEDDLPPVLGMIFSLLNTARTSRHTVLPASLQRLEPYEQFYHCFLHKVYSTPKLQLTPTVLARCPQCPDGAITSEILQPLNVEILHNSLYPSLIFVKEQVGRRTTVYIPRSAVLRAALVKAECHICSAQLQPGNWMCLFHNNRLELACVPCYTAVRQQAKCPACTLPFEPFPGPTPRQQEIEAVKGRMLMRNEQWCKLCLAAPTDWTLPCGHPFCFSCLALQPDLPDSLGCLYCGRVLDKAEHTDLLHALGRQ